MSVQVAYVNSLARHLEVFPNTSNAVSQILPASAKAQNFIPFPDFGRNPSYAATEGSSNYHAGAFSLYIDGIRRTDRLCAEVWKAIQTEPEYAGKTTLFILPDFGRDSDQDSAGNGFQHHRTGDAASRTTWMMALGPGIREGVVHDRALDSTDLVPTIGSIMRATP